MKAPFMRGLAWALLAAAGLLLPRRHRDWARAMRAEVQAIPEALQALAYAWGCFTAACQLAMASAAGAAWRPERVGLVGATVVVLLGGAFMAVQSAPPAYAWVHGLSLALALATYAVLPRRRLQTDDRWRAAAVVVLGLGLLALAPSAGQPAPAGGWLRLGPLAVQPVWVLWPVLLGLSAPRPGGKPVAGLRAAQAAGLVMGLLALALQAEPGWLAVTALVLAQRAWVARDVTSAGLALLALGLGRVALPWWAAPAEPLPFVDGVLQQAWAQSPAWGLALGLAWLGLLWPGLRWRQAREHGGCWAGLMALSLPGWLPAPVLGFGGSLVLGYVLSLAVVPRRSGPAGGLHPRPPPTPVRRDGQPQPHVRLA